jgi:hypothetical protein
MLRIRNINVKCSVFASSFSAILAPLVMLLPHDGQSCEMASQELVSILKRLNKTLRESLKHFFCKHGIEQLSIGSVTSVTWLSEPWKASVSMAVNTMLNRLGSAHSPT